MSHLLAISVGPVQEFISAARRTRDLWFGSHLLSEISRAVAKAVETEVNGTTNLIFPASSTADNVANVILAEVPSENPEIVASRAKQAATNCWMKFADGVYREAAGVIRQDIWNDQVHDVIEFYAAWVAGSDDYKEARRKLMRLLAGRKNCRDFCPAKGRAGVPKSSLDGQRESVLNDGDRSRWPAHLLRRLRLSAGEQLDVVGVVKRLAEGTRPYKSVTRLAADPWIRGVGRAALPRIINACNYITDLPSINDEVFRYDGHVLFVNRHPDYADETGIDIEQLKSIATVLRNLPEPSPYLAVLVADGDKMGAAISALASADAHREFSRKLAGFAGQATKIVNDHHGVLVYAGGDDVLAFLPVDQCLQCARKLHDVFGDELKDYHSPSLSVGIAIGHFMENLEDLLDYGRAAEKAAKKVKADVNGMTLEKDALAVHLHKRGGAPIEIGSRWDTEPDKRLRKFAELMNNGIIPTKLPYELRAMAKLYQSWNENADAAIHHDLVRVIAKKASKGVDTVKAAMDPYIKDMDAKKLLVLAKELLVARQIAVAYKQAGGAP